MLVLFLYRCELIIYLQTTDEVSRLTSCIWAHCNSALKQTEESTHGTEGGCPAHEMWWDSGCLVVRKEEEKAIPTQRSALSKEENLPPSLLMKQLEMITVSSTAQTTTQDRCEESCVNLAQDKVYERMQSRELKTTLSTKLKQPSPRCWLLFCLPVSHF